MVLDARFHGITEAHTLVNAGFGIRWAADRVTTSLKIVNLTNSGESWRGNYSPAYSPDGTRIAFATNRDGGNTEIYSMNASGGGLDDIGWRVLDPMEPVDLKVVPRPRTVELPPAAIDRVLGTYRYAPDDEMTITRGVTGLIVTAGPGQFLIQPQSRTRFFAKAGGDVYLDFPGPASKPADRMMLHQHGKTFVYHRVQPDDTDHD